MITQFTPYQIQSCLFDKKRTISFLKAINETVKRDQVVIDAGSGSGILGLFAAKAGAKKVYCIEANPRFLEIIKINSILNGFSKVIEVINGDATQIEIPQKADLLICELLSTGLFFEPEIQVINHLKKYLKDGGRIIPSNVESSCTLINAQRDVYGLFFDFDSRYEKLKNDKVLSTKVIFDRPNFYETEPLEVDRTIVIKAITNGIANAIRITSTAQLSENVTATKSKFLFNPLIIYFDNDKKLLKGKKYFLHIRYKKSEDSLGTKINLYEYSKD